MKLGAEPKKVAVLILLLAAAALFYQPFASNPATPSAAAPARTSPPAARQLRGGADDVLDSRTAARAKSQRATGDFRPSLKKSKPGEGPDPVQLDPTLRTDLLAKVQAVDYQGVERNLFQFGARKPKVTPPPAEAPKPEPSASKPSASSSDGPPPEPPKPTAPPVTMKYYGYVNRPGDARKRAFLMDGEEIFVAVEGEVIKKRYRVVRIGINSLVVEDMDFKSQQTLPLQESS